MSVLAKVFVVIQALLVMAYLGVSSTLYQHRRDWRDSYIKLRERYGRLSGRAVNELSALESAVGGKGKEISVKNAEVSSLKSDLDRALNDYQEEARKLRAKKTQVERMQEKNARTLKSNDLLQAEIKNLETRRDELDRQLREETRKRTIGEGQVARLMAIKFNLESDISDTRKAFTTARKDLRDAEVLIAMAEQYGVNFGALLDSPPVPLVKGRVRGVNSEISPALVLIDVGSSDKIEAGFRLSVYRDTVFIGKLVVERVEEQTAACREDWTVEGQTITAGDSVSTRMP